MVKRYDDQVAGRRRVQRGVDRIQVAFVETPMTIEPGPVVRPCRIYPHHMQARTSHRLYPLARHQRLGHIVTQAIVIAGYGDEPPVGNQRGENRFVGIELATQAAVGDVTRGDHALDARFHEGLAKLCRDRVRGRAAPDVQIGDVNEPVHAYRG